MGDYSHIDQLLQSPSTVPLGDVFMSQGIPITDKKIRRYVKHKGQAAPATTEGQMSLPPDRAGGRSARSPKADDGAAHPWSPSTADETTPEPDKGRSTSKLTELLRELTQREEQIANLKLQIQVGEDQISNLKRQIHLETAISKLPQKDAAGFQDSPEGGTKTSPRQSTQQAATATAPAPAPEILAVREANAKKEWRTVTIRESLLQPYQQEPNPFEDAFKAAVEPGRAAALLSLNDPILGPGAWLSEDDNNEPLPQATPVDGKARRTNLLARQFRALHPMAAVPTVATVVGRLGDPPQDMEQFLAAWTQPRLATSMLLRTGLAPSVGIPGAYW